MIIQFSWLRLGLLLCGCLLLLPFVLLHGLVLIFSRMEKPMAEVEQINFSQPAGTLLATFWRREADAEGTIIFVHGTPATATAFRQQMGDRFPGYNLVAYDRPGFGQSPGDPAQANLTYQTETLAGLIRQIPSPKIVLVGHSYGGPIILKTALLHPERIANLILIGGSVSPQEEHPWLLQYFGDWPLIRWLVPPVLRSCNEELLQLKADLLVLQNELPRLQTPLLMLQGQVDVQVPVENVDYLRAQCQAFGRSKFFHSRIYPAYTHFMLWEHFQEIDDEIRSFINPPFLQQNKKPDKPPPEK